MNMDGDMWAARLVSKRQQYILLDHQLCLDDVEGEEELRPNLACPYCFEPLDIFSLCSHIEDEHCFESRPVVCPVCVTKVGKDIVVHISTQHTNLFKGQRRRRFRKPAAFVQLNQANLQAILGTSCPPPAGRSASGSLPDLLLSTLVNVPVSDAHDPSPVKLGLDSAQAPVPAAVAAARAPSSSSDCCLTAEEREQKLEQATLRSHFMQQLVLSTLWC